MEITTAVVTQQPRVQASTSTGRALQWVRAHRLPGDGVVPFSRSRVATQEVTGYLIPTLCEWGERDLALELAEWEMSVQRPDGAFSAIDNVPYTFDSAQAVRGLLAVVDDLPQAEAHLRRACDFIASQITAEGEVRTPSYELWKFANGTSFSRYADLYVLPPLVAAGAKLAETRYVAAADRALNRFKRANDLTAFTDLGTFSHIFGYMMEGLAELGETALARKGLSHVARLQARDGGIPAYPGASWVCATGVAQLALAWYRIGERGPADKAVAYLESVQNPSGGFYGGYGRGVEYFPADEISWAVKFYLDAVKWRDRLAGTGTEESRG
jgi:malonyl-CoA O-methyltransferase